MSRISSRCASQAPSRNASFHSGARPSSAHDPRVGRAAALSTRGLTAPTGRLRIAGWITAHGSGLRLWPFEQAEGGQQIL